MEASCTLEKCQDGMRERLEHALSASQDAMRTLFIENIQKTETASKQYVEHRIQKLVDFQETLGKHIDRRLQDVERVASRSTEDQKLRDQLLYDSLDHSAKISLLEARLHQRCGPDELVERVKYVEVQLRELRMMEGLHWGKRRRG